MRNSEVITGNRWQHLENMSDSMSNMVLRDASASKNMVAHYHSEGLDFSLFTIVLVFVKWQFLIWDKTLWQLGFEALC